MADDNKQAKVFYSWQSDVAPKDNRYFIEEALKKAIKALNKGATFVDEIISDRDTKGVAGAPVIAETILGKIDEAVIFVCDVTIVSKATSGKSIPNPNVMIELGYALKALSHQSLILVLNAAYGDIQDLPFDLRHRRIMRYNLPQATFDSVEASENPRKKIERELQRDFEIALHEMLANQRVKFTPSPLSPVEQLEQYLIEPNDARKAVKLIEVEVDKLATILNKIAISSIERPLSSEEAFRLIQDYEGLVKNVLALYVRGCYDDDTALTKALIDGLNQLSNNIPPVNYPGNLHLYPTLLLLYAGGIAALAGNRYRTLIALMRKVVIRSSQAPTGCPAAFALVPYRVISERFANQILQISNHITPVNKYLFDFLREPLRQVIKVEGEYEEHFFRFEYLFALASAFANQKWGIGVYAPVGSYMWEQQLRYPPYIFEVTDQELSQQNELWPPFKEGIFDGKFEEFQQLKKQADESIKNLITKCYPISFDR